MISNYCNNVQCLLQFEILTNKEKYVYLKNIFHILIRNIFCERVSQFFINHRKKTLKTYLYIDKCRKTFTVGMYNAFWSTFMSYSTFPFSLDVKVWLCPCVHVYKGSYCGRYNGQILPVLAIKYALLPLTFTYIPYLHSQTSKSC